MIVNFPINKLLEKGLTADDYSIALLLKEGKFGLLDKYAKLSNNSFFESLGRLKEKGYIIYNTIGNIIPIREAKITDNFIDILSNGDDFDEFYNTFPIKVIRKGGNTDYLRTNKNKCRIKYKKVVKNNLMVHDHIMDCLKLEIENRTSRNNMSYMKKMENWLEKEEWKTIYEYKIEKEDAKLLSDKKKANLYGTDVL